ncbi:MAG: hypothetical protein GX330_08810 [Bacteroidales bacterium]|nr:hypothetical protein [Bacteroidales bacterium]
MKAKIFYMVLIISIINVMLMYSCQEIKPYPIVPYIEYRDFKKIDNGTGIDDKGILYIYFTDGDGNIGVKDNEPDSTYNFFMNYYEKQEGNWVKIDFPSCANFRLPMINTSKEPQSLEGVLELEVFFNNPISPYDTIQFECWLFDRDNHESNHIFTPAIVVRK